MTPQNFLYSVAPQRLSPAAAAVRVELKETIREPVRSRAWPDVDLLY